MSKKQKPKTRRRNEFDFMDNATATYALAAIGIGYAALSAFLVQKIGNPKRIKEIQSESTRLQKELDAALKAKDDSKIESVNKEYETFMPKMMEMFVLQMKPMIVIIPLLFILTPALRSWFANFTIKLPFMLPIFIQNFDKFPNWRDTFGAVGWFWLCVIAAGLGISIIKSVYDKLSPKAS